MAPAGYLGLYIMVHLDDVNILSLSSFSVGYIRSPIMPYHLA